MRSTRIPRTAVAAMLLGQLAVPAMAFLNDDAPTPAEVSIAKCQRATTKATAKLSQAESKAFQKCTDGASADYFSKSDIADTTTSKCVTALRTVRDTRNLGKSSTEKATAQIVKACEPGVGSNVHSLDDLLGGQLAQVRSSLQAKLLERISGPLGGPSTISSVQDYAAAVTKITSVKTQESLSKTVPNGPEMLTRLGQKVGALPPPPTDPNQVSDVQNVINQIQKRIDANDDGTIDDEPTTAGAACTTNGDCATNLCVAGACKCPNTLYTFNVSSNVSGLFDVAYWPGGAEIQGALPGVCDVTVARPDSNVDLVCGLAAPFAVVGFNGYSDCFGTGGEDGDGCQADTCPFAGIPSCCNARPSCSVGLNGQATARYFVQCVQ